MNFYRQSIIVFGAVIPAVMALAVVALGYFMKNKMTDSFDIKKLNYQAHHQARSEAAKVEQKVVVLRPHLERWDAQLAKEIASEMGTSLTEIMSKLPDKEIQQTAFNPSSKPGEFGGAQPSSQISIGLRGTFRTLQKAFLELESKMPQLQLEDISIEPVGTSSYLLNLQLTYTAWHD